MKKSRLTPAQRHFANMTAKKAAGQSKQGEEQKGSAYEMAQLDLANDMRQLKEVQSIQQKTNLKRKMVPKYDDYVDGVLEAGKGAQDNVLTTMLVWNIDIGQYGKALQIAEYALKHNLALPDIYERKIATVLMDEIAGAFLKDMPTPQVAMEVLIRVGALTEDHDAPDQARAKMYKATAYAMLAMLGDATINDVNKNLAESALKHLKRAIELHDGVGVKNDIQKLEKRLAKVASS